MSEEVALSVHNLANDKIMKTQAIRTRVKAPATSRTSKSPMATTMMNDGLVLNPDGRISSDADKDDPGRRFVRRKTPFSVSTFNVRTISSIQKKHELETRMKR